MPNLTLDAALADYPDELRTVLVADGREWNFDLDAKYKLTPRRLCLEAGCGDDNILAACLRWLAGKRMTVPPPDGGVEWIYRFPDDPLRALLGEVRTHLKLEKEA